MRSHHLLPDGNLLSSPDAFTRGIINEIYFARVYDKYFSLLEKMAVLDVGAHVGIFTLKMAKQVGSAGMVLAVEPNPQLLPYLKYNVVRNGYKNVVIAPYAASNHEGVEKLTVNLVNLGSSTLESSKKTSQTHRSLSTIVEVPLRRLDNVFAECSFSQFDLAKIDVEGVELDVLEGLGASIQKINWFSIAAYHYPAEADLLSQFLRGNGFKILVENQFVYGIRKS